MKRLFQALAIGSASATFWLFAFPVGAATDQPEIFVQMGHTSSINAVEISPDQKFILSGSDDESIKLWDRSSGRLIRTFKDGEDVEYVHFLPGGRAFFSVNDKGRVAFWDKERNRFHCKTIKVIFLHAQAKAF